MRWSRYSDEIDFQASSTICPNLSPGTLLFPSNSGYFSCIQSFIESQTCSIRLRSGENGGHVRRLIPLLENSTFVAWALCEGALSYVSKRNRLVRTLSCVSDNICENGTPPCVNEREKFDRTISSIRGTILWQYFSAVIDQLYEGCELVAFHPVRGASFSEVLKVLLWSSLSRRKYVWSRVG